MVCYCILIMLFILKPATTQEAPKSFRNEATGSALLDDLDLVYDPIELSFVDSVRLFTNLSNLVSTEEAFMDQKSDNTLLFGISLPNPFYKKMHTSILVTYNHHTLPRDVRLDRDMDGYFDVTGEGHLEDNFVAYKDVDNDGIFDRKNRLDQEISNNITNRRHLVLLTGSLPLTNLVIGGRVGIGETVTETGLSPAALGKRFEYGFGVDADAPSFSRQMRLMDLAADSTLDHFDEKGEFNTLETANFIGFAASAMTQLGMPWGQTEARIDVGFKSSTDEMRSDNLYSFAKNNFPVETAFYKNSDQYIQTNETKTNHISVGASLKRIFATGTERRYDGFWRITARYSHGFGDWEESEKRPRFEKSLAPRELLTIPISYDSNFTELIERENSAFIDDGTFTQKAVLLAANAQMPLNNKVTLGIGVACQRHSYHCDSNLENFSETQTLYEVLDDTATVEDFKENAGYSLSYDHNKKTRRNILEVPVGLEYAFTNNNKWRIRFGALFSMRQVILYDTKNVKHTHPYTIRSETGDGRVTVDIDLSNSEYASAGERRENISTRTLYTYGLGFYPTSNLQVDLLGF